jgi:hypothetical protein
MCRRGGFTDRRGRPDTSWLERRAGLRGRRSAATAAASSSVGAGPSMAGAALAVAIAVTLELMPERVDLVGLVLHFSGLGSLVALVLAVTLGADDALYAKYGTLVGGYTGLALFLVLFSVQGSAEPMLSGVRLPLLSPPLGALVVGVPGRGRA